MLCLGRRTGERILIGPDIELIVVRIKEGSVRLAIRAPKGVLIQRSELVAALAAEDDRVEREEDREAA